MILPPYAAIGSWNHEISLATATRDRINRATAITEGGAHIGEAARRRWRIPRARTPRRAPASGGGAVTAPVAMVAAAPPRGRLWRQQQQQPRSPRDERQEAVGSAAVAGAAGAAGGRGEMPERAAGAQAGVRRGLPAPACGRVFLFVYPLRLFCGPGGGWFAGRVSPVADGHFPSIQKRARLGPHAPSPVTLVPPAAFHTARLAGYTMDHVIGYG